MFWIYDCGLLLVEKFISYVTFRSAFLFPIASRMNNVSYSEITGRVSHDMYEKQVHLMRIGFSADLESSGAPKLFAHHQ